MADFDINFHLFFSSALQQLFRKKPGELMNIALLPDNVFKNRYRDISPCKFGLLIATNELEEREKEHLETWAVK